MIKLSEIPTSPPEGYNKNETKEKTKVLAKRIGELQEIFYAEKNRSLLVIFQGMDSSGKDGATRKVFNRCSPAGTSCYSFKKPTDKEFSHDFLWRVHQEVPSKGEIKIFNRSHYEDILIQRVYGWIDESQVSNRMAAINAFEQLLVQDNNTAILKFYLHQSFERQGEKLQERIDNPEKHWKHNPGDWEERKHWHKYMRCYEDAINRSKIPWHIIPVDARPYRSYAIAAIVAETLESFNLKFPGFEK